MKVRLIVSGALLCSLVIGSLQVALAAKPVGPPQVPRFVEETMTAGLEHRYDGGWQYFVGGGVAVLDCDADRRPDLYLAGGAEPASLYRNASAIAGPLLFETADSDETALRDVTGAYPIDVDADGVLDIAVLRRGENVLLRGLGDCGFARANEAWGFDGGADWTTAFSATWEPGAALPTLALGDYLTVVERGEVSNCDDSAIFRSGPDERYQAPIALRPGYCTLSMLFSDWDRSGRRDLRVTNDRQYYIDGEDQLWRIEAGEAPRPWTREEGWQRLRVWGMGLASEDLSGDGYPELYVSSMGDNKLQSLDGGPPQPAYGDIALQRGATAHRPFRGGEALPSTAWHAEFDDVNNDGHMDLFVAKGNVEAMPDHAARDPNNLLLGDAGGNFSEAAGAAGILDFERSRGAAVADLNLDGLLDLVVVERREPVRIWRNVGRGSAAKPGPMGNWLAIDLIQAGPNVDAIGAWIEVRAGGSTTEREVAIGGGHASGQAGPTHFGLGGARTARVRVTWPHGARSRWWQVPVNAIVTLHGQGPGDCPEGCLPQPPEIWQPDARDPA